MKQKHTMLLLAILLVTATAYTQTTVGFTGGLTFAKMYAKADETQRTKSITGFSAGIFFNTPLSKHFSFEPALNYIQKGGKNEQNGETYKLVLNYIEVPLNFIYTSGSNRSGFFVGAGPAISLGMNGKATNSSPTASSPEDIKFGSGDDKLSSVELSGNIVAGIRFNPGLLLSLNYNSGISNLFHKTDDGTMRNNYWGLKAGISLGRKKR